MTLVSKYGRGWWLLSSLNGGSGGLGVATGLGWTGRRVHE